MLKKQPEANPIAAATQKCQDALEVLLRVIIRMSIRVGITYPSFQQLCQQLYVDVAHNEFAGSAGPASIARTALISGISRKTVRNRLQAATRKAPPPDVNVNMLSGWLLSAWRNRDDCVGPDGSPKPLTFSDGEPSISSLVNEIYLDVNPRDILQELIRSGTVEKMKPDLYRLTRKWHFTENVYDTYMKGLTVQLPRHAEAIEYNMMKSTVDQESRNKSGTGRFERVAFDIFPSQALGSIRRITRDRCTEFLESIDDVLTLMSKSHHIDQKSDKKGLVRAGIGIYYWERDGSA